MATDIHGVPDTVTSERARNIYHRCNSARSGIKLVADAVNELRADSKPQPATALHMQPGAKLKPDNGVVITIDGPYSAELAKCFDIDDPGVDPEVIANVTIAYRHLEDASMRLGKALQALDGGVSVYDKSTTVGA